MGLDQYANWTDGTTDEQGNLKKEEFMYWRKTSHIQDFFQKIYAEKTGDTDPSNFNCVSVEIDFDVLNRFITAVKNKQMKPVGGFFFGCSYDPGTEEYIEQDLKFASECFFHLLMGRKVEYSSWW
jgi:hypothetical protein